MGLALVATGFNKDMHIGYGGFSGVRCRIAKAYSEKHGKLYEEMLRSFRGLADDFNDRWNDGCNDDLDILLWHSDCDGKLTYQECGKIYNVLKTLDVEDAKDEESFYNDFVEMLQHCHKRRVNMYFY